MKDIAKDIEAYLRADDSLYRAQVRQEAPNFEARLNAPETRRALLDWLRTDEAWADGELAQNVIEFLQTSARADDVQTIRSFLMHPKQRTRLAAYEYLRGLYFGADNREALLQLLQNMLMDADNVIRAQAARHIQQAKLVDEMRGYLERWRTAAIERGWGQTESHELVERLLRN